MSDYESEICFIFGFTQKWNLLCTIIVKFEWVWSCVRPLDYSARSLWATLLTARTDWLDMGQFIYMIMSAKCIDFLSNIISWRLSTMLVLSTADSQTFWSKQTHCTDWWIWLWMEHRHRLMQIVCMTYTNRISIITSMVLMCVDSSSVSTRGKFNKKTTNWIMLRRYLKQNCVNITCKVH